MKKTLLTLAATLSVANASDLYDERDDSQGGSAGAVPAVSATSQDSDALAEIVAAAIQEAQAKWQDPDYRRSLRIKTGQENAEILRHLDSQLSQQEVDIIRTLLSTNPRALEATFEKLLYINGDNGISKNPFSRGPKVLNDQIVRKMRAHDNIEILSILAAKVAYVWSELPILADPYETTLKVLDLDIFMELSDDEKGNAEVYIRDSFKNCTHNLTVICRSDDKLLHVFHTKETGDSAAREKGASAAREE